MHAQPTRILMIFKRILRASLGGVPRIYATNVSVQKIKHVFKNAYGHVLYVVLRKGLSLHASVARMG